MKLLTGRLNELKREAEDTARVTRNLQQAIGELGVFTQQQASLVVDAQNAFADAIDVGGIREIQQARRELVNELISQTDLANRLFAIENQGEENRHARIANTIRNEIALRRALFQVLGSESRAILSIRQRETDTRIRQAQRVRTAEVNAYNEAASTGRLYAQQLQAIDSIAGRRFFVSIIEGLVEQGLSFRDAIQRASEYTSEISSMTDGINRADVAFGTFNATLGQNRTIIEQSVGFYTNLIEVLQNVAREVANAQTPITINEDIRQQNVDEDIRRQAQQANEVRIDSERRGLRTLEGLLRRHEREKQQIAEQGSRQQQRIVRRTTNFISSNLSATLIQFVTTQEVSFQQVATAFIAESIRIITQHTLEVAQRTLLSTTLTEIEIANIRRVTEAYRQAALERAGFGIGVNSINTLQAIGAAASGINPLFGGLTSVPIVIRNFLSIGTNQAREISDLQVSAIRERQ